VWLNVVSALADAAQYLRNTTGVFATSPLKINWWKSYVGSDGITRYVQGNAMPGSGAPTTGPYDSKKLFSVSFMVSHGLTSRGRIGLDNMLTAKILTQPWFTTAADEAVMVQAITEFFADIKKVPGITLLVPAANITAKDFVASYDRLLLNNNHWVGSAKLGTDSGLKGGTSVVDVNTKVYGTNNLFVVDASIFPGTTMSNPHAAIMQAAEYAVSRILALK